MRRVVICLLLWYIYLTKDGKKEGSYAVMLRKFGKYVKTLLTKPFAAKIYSVVIYVDFSRCK